MTSSISGASVPISPKKTGTRDIQFPADLPPADLISNGKALIAKAREDAIERMAQSAGRSVCSRLSRFYDSLLAELYRHLTSKWEAEGRGEPGSICFIALGGYGRRELCLHSDIDLLILLGDRKGKQEDFAKEFLHVLYDWGLDVGHSVRRLSECLLVINTDSESTTSMLESHRLAGSRPLFQHYHETFYRTLRTSGRKWFLQTKFREWNSRREKFDSSVYLLEPNLKEVTGGLRDIHSVRWLLLMLKGTGELKELAKLGILDDEELAQLKNAEEFMLGLRNQLHALAPRKNDVLNFHSQIQLAPILGYKPKKGHLAEELMMQDYYRRAREVSKYCNRAFSILLREEKSSLGSMLGSLKRKRLDSHFLAQNSVIFCDDKHPDYLSEDPTRIMALFARARKIGMRVSERTRDSIEKSITDLDEGFQADPKNVKAFMEILKGKAGVAQTLEDMHDCGFLSAFVPEFEHVRCMVRMDQYHRYTVDEHLIKSVEMVEKLLVDPPAEMQHAAQVAKKIERLGLLNLALLFHDVGKGRGKGHALIGGQVIQVVGKRFGLPREDVELLQFLILSHLKIGHVAQRRDLSEPTVAVGLAEEIGSLERLDMLYVHSVCDVGAVSPDAFTEWKSQLYEQCYHATADALRGRTRSGSELSDTQANTMATRVWEYFKGQKDHFPEGDSQAKKVLRQRLREFINGVPERYLRSTRVEVITEHFLMTQRIDDKTKVLWSLDPGLGVSELTVCTADTPGSFAMVCGALKAKGINICSAQVFSTSDGLAINCVEVTDLAGRPLPAGFRLERLRGDLNRVFLEKLAIEELIEKYETGPVKAELPSVRRPTEIRFANEASPTYTILEIRTTDRPGLLYQIASALNDLKLNIYRALLNTEAYGVFDVFYVTDLEYNKIYDKHVMAKIEKSLTRILDEGIAEAELRESEETRSDSVFREG